MSLSVPPHATDQRRTSAAPVVERPLRIGLLAPPWVSVPPSGYGGTESHLDRLARGLQEAGHEVRLWTTGRSTCPVRRGHVYEEDRMDAIGSSAVEARHALAGYEWFESERCHLVHDHTLVGPFVQHRLPVITTNHGPFDEPELTAIYRSLQHRVPIVAISRSQATGAQRMGISVAHVIHHGISVEEVELGSGQGDEHGKFVLFLGRVNPAKGIERAIRVARSAGVRLLIAAKMHDAPEVEYYRSHIEPRCGDDVVFLGEVGGSAKQRLLGAAAALLNPIQWPEPFGLVMIEALAAGTPVVTTSNGAAPEIVEHGRSGFVCETDDELVRALRRLDTIDRTECRRAAFERFSTTRMVERHVTAYRQLLATQGARVRAAGLSPRTGVGPGIS
jgi:glycosyltransferase involved in cell wall biosynthesis